MNKQSIIVGLSGGIDSAVTALLLRDAGWDVVGVTLLMQPIDLASAQKACGGDDSVAAAEAVARFLGIRYETFDCRDAFEREVLRPCWETFAAGATPNPCIICNPRVKFNCLLQAADRLGAKAIATGHYARLATAADGTPLLRRGLDSNKDQTYFLYRLTPAMLRRIRFPLGGFTKPQVREKARACGLPNTSRPESQDVCFAEPGEPVAEQLRKRYHGEAKPGNIIDENGRILGRHTGIHQYTIGQRRGLRIALGTRAKITAINPETATITLSDRPDASFGRTCSADLCTWQQTPPTAGTEILAQVRYRQKAVRARVDALAPDASSVSVTFAEPVFGITPGQSLVLYSGDSLLGGGIIRPVNE